MDNEAPQGETKMAALGHNKPVKAELTTTAKSNTRSYKLTKLTNAVDIYLYEGTGSDRRKLQFRVGDYLSVDQVSELNCTYTIKLV
jgi:hypothetical protein